MMDSDDAALVFRVPVATTPFFVGETSFEPSLHYDTQFVYIHSFGGWLKGEKGSEVE
jgi:hypothetical protein